MIDENSCYIGMSVIWRDYDDPDLYSPVSGHTVQHSWHGEVIGFSRGKDSFVIKWENGVTITYYYNKVPDSLVVDYEKVRSDKLWVFGI